MQEKYQKIKDIFQEICQIEYQDGVKFDPTSITAEIITKESKYEGIRVKVLFLFRDCKKKITNRYWIWRCDCP